MHTTQTDQPILRMDRRAPAITLDPELRTRCEVWTRVMGYHRPVSSFNIGKKGEFHERKFFEESAASKP